MNWLALLLYAAAAVFLTGMAWRLFTWLRAPVPLKIVLTPGPLTSGGVARRLAGEVLLFRSLLRANWLLWAAAWLFHVSLLLLILGHFAGLAVPGFTRALLGLTEKQFHLLAQITGDLLGVLAFVPLVYLLLRRVMADRLRFVATFADYFALVLLLLIIVTGDQMRFMNTLDLSQARQFVTGLLTLHPALPPADAAFSAHVVLVCALLVYIPFSKLVHLGGLVFNPTLNQTNTPRQERHVGPWDKCPA